MRHHPGSGAETLSAAIRPVRGVRSRIPSRLPVQVALPSETSRRAQGGKKPRRRYLALAAAGLAVAIIVIAALYPAPSSTAPYKFTIYPSDDGYQVKDNAGSIVHSSTDGTAAVQYALDALTAGRTGKEKVLLQGNLMISSALAMPSNAILQLDGKVTLASGARTGMIYANGAKHFEVTGGEWDGNGNDKDNLFNFVDCSDLIVSDLSVHDGRYNNVASLRSPNATYSRITSYNSSGSGLGLQYSGYQTVKDCHVHDVASGIYIYAEDDGVAQDLSNVVIRGNTVERTERSGIEASSLRGAEDTASNSLVENNTCIDCGTDGDHPGIRIGWSYSDKLRHANSSVVRNNAVRGTGAYELGGGIACEAHNSSVIGNVVDNIFDYGILVRGDRNTVSGNEITRCGQLTYPSLEILDGSGNEVVNNNFSESSNGGVLIAAYLTPGSNDNRIADNRVEKMADYLVNVNDTMNTGNVIEHNTFVGTSTIIDQGKGTVIRDNKFII